MPPSARPTGDVLIAAVPSGPPEAKNVTGCEITFTTPAIIRMTSARDGNDSEPGRVTQAPVRKRRTLGLVAVPWRDRTARA